MHAGYAAEYLDWATERGRRRPLKILTSPVNIRDHLLIAWLGIDDLEAAGSSSGTCSPGIQQTAIYPRLVRAGRRNLEVSAEVSRCQPLHGLGA